MLTSHPSNSGCRRNPAKRSAGALRLALAWVGLTIASAAVADEPTALPAAPLPGTPVIVETPAPVVRLSLDEIIQTCLHNDPKLFAGMEAIRQSQADRWTASLAPNPEMSVGIILLPLGREYTPAAPGGPTELDVGVSYPIDWYLFGKQAAAIASATMAICVSESDYADLVRQRVTQAALGYYDVLEAQALRDVARDDLANLERVEAVTAKAVENGGRPQVDLHRVRLELLTARRLLRDAEANLVKATATLASFLGGVVTAAGLEVSGTLDGALTAQPLAVDAAFALAAESRPDIESLRRKVAKAQRDCLVESRNAYPEVKTDFGFARQYQTTIGAPDISAWGTALTATVPLFNRNQGNRSKAAAVVSQSNYELQTSLLELRAEIEQAVQALRTAQQNAASVAQEELRLAAQVRDAIAKAYAAGGRPLVDMLDARRNYRETYRTFVSARADYWRALYRYNAAIGEQLAR